MAATTIRYATGIARSWLIDSTLNPIVQVRPTKRPTRSVVLSNVGNTRARVTMSGLYAKQQQIHKE